MAIGVGIWNSGFGIWPTTALAHDPITTKVTWAREISAILERRCISCHSPNGYAGFSLATYEEARPWAVAIKEEVLSGQMPPWGAATGVGHFANDRRLTRHELELIASWVDGGAPFSVPPVPIAERAARPPLAVEHPAGGTAIPLAATRITEARQRTASVTLQMPDGMVLTAWTFEPGAAAIVERVDLELGARWLGTWTPGESSIEFPHDAGVPLTSSTLFTARIGYQTPHEPITDHSRLRVWIAKETRAKTLQEVTVVKGWRALSAVDVVALRPMREADEVEVVARYADGHAEPLGVLDAPSHGLHPTYRLAAPVPLLPGTRLETTAPVRVIYSAGATRTVKSNLRRRPRR